MNKHACFVIHKIGTQNKNLPYNVLQVFLLLGIINGRGRGVRVNGYGCGRVNGRGGRSYVL